MFVSKRSRSILRNCRNFVHSFITGYAKSRLVVLRIWSRNASAKTDLYRYFDYVYRYKSPHWLKEHREYFVENQRGYGANAFHAAWYEILKRFKPTHMLEIGVYRGQVLSLWQLIADREGFKVEVSGITPLDNSGDQVSDYPALDYEQDIRNNFGHFDLAMPKLVRSYSTDPDAANYLGSKLWDVIYLDGNHDFDVVLSDYRMAIKFLKPGGLICLDDSSLYLSYPISGDFRGHHGPSQVVRDHALDELTHFLTVGHNNFFIKV